MDHSSHLYDILATLPGDALLPAAWVRAQLDKEPAGKPAGTADLDVAAFARLVGRSAAQVRVWLRHQRLPGAYRLPGNKRPGAWRIPSASVAAFRERLRAQPAAAVVVAAESGPQATGIGAWRSVRGLRRA